MNKQVSSRLSKVNQIIHDAEIKYQRPSGSVRLIAISKTKPIQDIVEAIASGQRDFGESYVQEAVEKIELIKNENITWHFVGPIQKNKTKLLAQYFDWVHSVDRLIIAERLNAQRPEILPPLQICIQVNIGNEISKSGMPIEHVLQLAKSIQQLSKIELRGLMAIPKATSDMMEQRNQFAQLRLLLERLNKHGFNLDTLSMGMSADMEAAIAEGSTIVRIGTAIFGERIKNLDKKNV